MPQRLQGAGKLEVLGQRAERDVALGVGAITCLKEETQDAEWVAMGALADAGDSLAMWLAPIGWRRFANAMFAKSMAIVGLLCARQLADERNPSTEVDAVVTE